MKRFLALVLCASTASSACSFAVSSTQAVSVTPSHPKAEVHVDGKLLGNGPQTVELERKRSHSVMAKCGDSAGTAGVGRRLSRVGILDIIFGAFFLFPLLGLASPGAFDLSPLDVFVAVPDTTACDESAA